MCQREKKEIKMIILSEYLLSLLKNKGTNMKYQIRI